ncbi:MAG: hypothetical protein K0B84_02015 [Firmicutes bacterium]|nr:hypothetical protein [Bacillota bacterium]
MADEIYRRLQQQLDSYSVGFPATESGVEIKILEYLFSKEDAELFRETGWSNLLCYSFMSKRQ